MEKRGPLPDQALREAAYYIWESEGRPDGRAYDHWLHAIERFQARGAPPDEHLEDEEKVLEGRHDVNLPALLTKDVPGG